MSGTRGAIDIISKKDGPRDEDREAKRHVQRNWGTIEKLADTLSGGSCSANKSRQAAPPPQARGLIFADYAGPRAPDAPEPYLRISGNGRVVVADAGSGVQLQFLGQLKRIDGELRFLLATAANGFISPLAPETEAKLADLAGRALDRAYAEDDLARDIRERLGIG